MLLNILYCIGEAPMTEVFSPKSIPSTRRSSTDLQNLDLTLGLMFPALFTEGRRTEGRPVSFFQQDVLFIWHLISWDCS